MEESHNIKKLKDEDEDAMIKVDLQNSDKKKHTTCLEWCQLIATICIPIIIALYTIIQDRQNLHKANMSRATELQIAEENRLNELLIAEENRQKDRDLAKDQQWENILVEYHRFLSGFFVQKGLSLKESDGTILLSVSHTTLNQLNVKRKSYVIRSLYEAKLIALNINSDQSRSSFLEIGGIDLSNIMLGSVHDPQGPQSLLFYIDWSYLYLPRAILVNASIRYAILNCAFLHNTKLDSADLSFAYVREAKCFNKWRESSAEFSTSSLVNATLYHADFNDVSFYNATLTFANMSNIQCCDCDFRTANLVRVDLSGCNISRSQYHTLLREFESTNLSYTTADLSIFHSLTFDYSDWSHVQAKQIRMINCTFVNATMINASFVKGSLSNVLFQQTDLSYIDMTYAILKNISFIDTIMYYANLSYIKCEYCNFINIDLRNSLLRNASLLYSNFVNCSIDEKQVGEIIDLGGSKLPNETIVQGND
ncbi:unnamed protein product [Adineta ricciae]|uniref:Pentapeptide repeat-containing protein n=1 Tax=Adineta ricciae TaxID=249248 RepID=A0A815VH93_ADIRI|nr:unnamed protein product [Adineta ricciae]